MSARGGACTTTSLRWAAALVAAATAAGCASAPGGRGRTSVVVIVTDSLRADRLRLYNPQDGVPTPAIEALAARGVTFTNAWAAAPWTAPSVVSIFTGLYPPSHGVVLRDDTTPPDLPTLPRLLAARGYRLGNFAFFSEVPYFRNLGFPPGKPGPGHDAGAGLAAFISGGSPFLAWVHLIEAHLPYGAPGYESPEVRERGSSGLELAQRRAEVPVGVVGFAPGDRERVRRLYDADVAALDRSVASVIAALAAGGALDDTIVVLVADHGEELLEHGWVGHASTALDAKLLPEILRVPLVIAGPGVPAGATSDALVHHVDIVPTLLRLLRIRAPRLDGVSLLPPERSPASRVVFFDSSAGGNLTPEARRGERLQGATDGGALLVARASAGEAERVAVTTMQGETVAPSVASRLAAALAEWRRDQARQRLALLRGRLQAPAAADVESYAETLAVISPSPGEALDRDRSAAQIVLRWSGAGADVFIEYEIGSGLRRVSGRFAATGSQLVFGPFPQAFWDELAAHSPFRFRVVEVPTRRRSAWVEFTITPSS